MKEEVNIPKGIADGMAIKLNNKGNFNGDLLLKVNVKKSSVFTR
jgi:DnaJ-class molecular chaperone